MFKKKQLPQSKRGPGPELKSKSKSTPEQYQSKSPMPPTSPSPKDDDEGSEDIAVPSPPSTEVRAAKPPGMRNKKRGRGSNLVAAKLTAAKSKQSGYTK